MTDSTASQRPADIVSPITDSALADKASPADARKAGRAVRGTFIPIGGMNWDKCTPQGP